MLGAKYFARGLIDDAARDAVLPRGPCAQERAATQQIDSPRHSTRQAVDGLQGLSVKRQRAGMAGHCQAVLNVLRGLGLGQRIQVEARNHALGQLLQLGTCQHGAQLGLANQHDLQQLARVGFQVGQQTQLFQHISLQVLRLVNDEHTALASRVALQQERVQRVNVIFDGGGCGSNGPKCDVELFADGLQQLHNGELGVEDISHMAAGRNLLQKAATDRRLTGANVSGQQYKTTTGSTRRALRA